MGQRKKGILLKTTKFFVSGRETVLQRGDRISGKQFICHTFAYSIASVWLWEIRTTCSTRVNIFCIFGKKAWVLLGMSVLEASL